ncbi:hypothetical protein CMV_008451 [Castanea mollissima]|uniref:ER membrane protein complex subunit 6 n=1 Tax=Castanea mollissima TaxID=60419 RepID=A0A8J4RML3_9ROSI|nr:hypothetical protein CMV_008451 [Castanea mollissima]
MKAIYYSRTFLSIIGGVIAGILGFTSLTGFIFYFLVMAITSVGLIAKSGFSIHSYFDSWNRVIFDGFLSGLMSFVLFWTFAYDMQSHDVAAAVATSTACCDVSAYPGSLEIALIILGGNVLGRLTLAGNLMCRKFCMKAAL